MSAIDDVFFAKRIIAAMTSSDYPSGTDTSEDTALQDAAEELRRESGLSLRDARGEARTRYQRGCDTLLRFRLESRDHGTVYPHDEEGDLVTSYYEPRAGTSLLYVSHRLIARGGIER